MINNSKLTIIIAVLIISFIGYHVLTVEATTVTKEDIRKMKFTNDDLDEHGLKDIAIEQACKDNGGQWKDNEWCKFDKKGKTAGDEVEFEHQLEDRGLSYYYDDKEFLGEEWGKYEQEKYEESQKQEEKAAKEDALCDNEDADTTNIEACMLDKREQDNKRVEQACDDAGLKMTKDGMYCDTNNEKGEDDADKFYREYDNDKVEEPEPPVIEDWKNEVTPEVEVYNNSPKYEFVDEELEEEQQEEIKEFNESQEESGEEQEVEEDEPEEEEGEESEPEEEDNSDSESESDE